MSQKVPALVAVAIPIVESVSLMLQKDTAIVAIAITII
jgi:ABC-type arginine transport system permease subunit